MVLSLLQALGCVLFMLCFNEHPFEDSAKLRIINANYSIPESDTQYTVFHDLLSKYSSITLALLWKCTKVILLWQQRLTSIRKTYGPVGLFTIFV